MKGFKSINWIEIVVLAVVMFAVGILSQLFVEEETAILQEQGENALTSFTVKRSITNPWKKA